MPLIDRQQAPQQRIPLPQSSAGLLLGQPGGGPVRPDASGMGTPGTPQQVPQRPEPAWLSANPMQPGMLNPLNFMGTMGGPAAEPGIIEMLLAKAAPELRGIVEAALQRGTPHTAGELGQPLPIKGGQMTMHGMTFTPSGAMPHSVEGLSKLAGGRGGAMDLGTMSKYLRDMHDEAPNAGIWDEHAATTQDQRVWDIADSRLPDMNFTVRDAQGGDVAHAMVHPEITMAEAGSAEPKVQITIDLASAERGMGRAFDPGGAATGKIGMDGLTDIAGHVLSIYRKNYGFEPDVVGGFRIKTDEPLQVPIAKVRKLFEAHWKSLFGAAAAVPTFDIIHNGAGNEQDAR